MIAAFCLELRSPFCRLKGDLFFYYSILPLLCRRSLRADELILPVHFHFNGLGLFVFLFMG